jgi:hypothetical protein
MPIKKNTIQIDNQKNDIIIDVTKSKRGRKSKKELLESLNLNNNKSIINIDFQQSIPTSISTPMSNTTYITDNNNNTNNITLQVEEGYIEQEEKDIDNLLNLKSNSNEEESIQKPIAKKRGRKPKGGKIVTNKIELDDKKPEKMNIILHLKCSTKDLQSKNDTYMIYPFSSGNNDEINIIGNLDVNNINSNIEKYNDTAVCTSYNNETVTSIYNINNYQSDNDNDNENDSDCDYDNNTNLVQRNKEIHKKIRVLENNLHHNNIPNKRCCCFWDTCEFDNPPIYLIKSIINGVYSVYGCFCSTECACAYLFEEKIDSSVKFERYQLLNNTYGKIYEYTKNVRPAPNPYYMLNKFYGNLTIQEYRTLLSNDRLFLVLDKPVTKIFPELHEDNDEFLLNNKIIPSNNTGNNIKNKLQKKKQTKSSVVHEKFGIGQHSVLAI